MLITWGITNELMQMDHNSPNISINTNITDGYTFTVHSSNSSFYIVRFADLVLVLLKYIHSFFIFLYMKLALSWCLRSIISYIHVYASSNLTTLKGFDECMEWKYLIYILICFILGIDTCVYIFILIGENKKFREINKLGDENVKTKAHSRLEDSSED